MLDHPRSEETDGRAEATARAAEELATELGSTPEAVRAHLGLLPLRYGADLTPRAIVRHTLMASSRPGPTEIHTRVTPGNDDPDGVDALRGLDVLDVVALDHHGWFARVAGVVALHGGSIVAAVAFARADGLAVDTFHVRRPDGVGGSWWAHVEGDLVDAAAGRLAVRARVHRAARSHGRRGEAAPLVPTTVQVGPEAAGRASVVEVRTDDRIGVLYAIASAMAELQLDIVSARIETLGREVRDVFHVQDGERRPLGRDHVAELDLAVTAALADLRA